MGGCRVRPEALVRGGAFARRSADRKAF